MFFDSSLRTRASFLPSVLRNWGGTSVHLRGRARNLGIWNTRKASSWDGDKTGAHCRRRAGAFALLRCAGPSVVFPSLKRPEEDAADPVIEAFRRYATVPVINLESALYHPCQAMADMLTIRERFGRTEGVRVALAWTPHIKALPTAVPNSFALVAAQLGCRLTIVAPPEFPLPGRGDGASR
jgi:N-acetylornithine carbamoyltransferase